MMDGRRMDASCCLMFDSTADIDEWMERAAWG